MQRDDVSPKRSKEFSMVYDFLNGFTVDVPIGVDEKIFAKYKELLPDDLLQEVYLGRSLHHILCLIDGISKYNSIIQHRDKIECREEDIEEASYIFGAVIGTWNANMDIYKCPRHLRYEYLSVITQGVYDKLRKMQGCTAAELQKACTLSSTDYHLKMLIEYELVKVIELPNGGDTSKRYYTWDEDPTLDIYLDKKEDEGENA
jgi:hypothetical protein